MASEQDSEISLTAESKEKKGSKHDSGAADLEKITDHVEEAEIASKTIGDVSLFWFNFIIAHYHVLHLL